MTEEIMNVEYLHEASLSGKCEVCLKNETMDIYACDCEKDAKWEIDGAVTYDDLWYICEKCYYKNRNKIELLVSLRKL